MTYCKRCGVRVQGRDEYCVLCGARLGEPDGEEAPIYPHIKFSNRMRYLLRVLAMVSVVLVALSLYFDHVTDSDTIWSLIVLGATIYGWTSFLTARRSFKNVGLMIFIQLIAISVLGYVIDLSTGNHGWMLGYVIPFLIVAAQGIITSVMLVRPMLFRDFVLYQFMIGILGILSILLMVFGLTAVRWPYITACVYSALILAGTILLADRKTKQEMVKRFHF